ncbi:MAG: hypothetical protein E6J53_02835 [Chloroflexi bacterium]|nr:MAG: hypothetical protein E6J53_02835 [Chloroflexota bacterium]
MTKFEPANLPGGVHTLGRAWQKQEKQRGKLGMTWRLKVQGVVIGVVVLGALAVAAGANWVEWLEGFLF